MLMGWVLRVKDMAVHIQKWSTHKKPVLSVKFDDENCLYKIASFNSEETAEWFVKNLEERLK